MVDKAKSANAKPKKAPAKTAVKNAAKTAKPVVAKKVTPVAAPQKVVFFTGFPGFLGKRIIRKMLAEKTGTRFIFLAQEKFLDQAKQAVEDLREVDATFPERVTLLPGDLRADDLGFDAKALADLRANTTEVWHLAAVYDLSVPAKIAWEINVEGTRRMLDLCESMKKLEKFIYFSTCYVGGIRTGLVLEDDLDYGQGFKNNYESTKFEAEVLVRRRMDKIPTIVIRPSIVIGDSRTGETDKYDGPYFLIRFLAESEFDGYLKPFKGFRLPSLGKGNAFFNLVPVDYLLAATWHIVARPEAIGQTYQVCDPDPLTTREFYDEIYKVFGLGKTLGALPLSLVRMSTKLPVLGDFMYIPESVLPYVDHFAVYDTSKTLAMLKETDIRCPHLSTYIGTLIDYVRAHLDKQNKYAKY